MSTKPLDTTPVAAARQTIAQKLAARVANTRSKLEDYKAIFFLGTGIFSTALIGLALATPIPLLGLIGAAALVTFPATLAYHWGHARATADAALKNEKEFIRNPAALVAAEVAAPKVAALLTLHDCRANFDRVAKHHADVTAQAATDLAAAQEKLEQAMEQAGDTLRVKDGLQAPRKTAVAKA